MLLGAHGPTVARSSTTNATVLPRWTFRNFFDLPSAPPPMTIVPASASTTRLVGLFCICPSGETVASRPMCYVAR